MRQYVHKIVEAKFEDLNGGKNRSYPNNVIVLLCNLSDFIDRVIREQCELVRVSREFAKNRGNDLSCSARVFQNVSSIQKFLILYSGIIYKRTTDGNERRRRRCVCEKLVRIFA